MITARIMTRLEVWSDFQCVGGIRLAVLEPSAVSARETTAGDDQLSFNIPMGSNGEALVVEHAVIRVNQDQAGDRFDEWLVSSATRKAMGGTVAVVCDPAYVGLLQRRGGVVGVTDGAGFKRYDTDIVGLTPTQILDTFVVPTLTAMGLGVVSRGTVNPTAPIDLTLSWDTPLSLVRKICDTCTVEFQLRRNGVAGYSIDLLTKIGATAPVADLRTRKNLTEVSQQRQADNQATRVWPRGSSGAESFKATIGDAMWQITAINAGTGEVTFADPIGGAGPILKDGQLNGYLIRKTSGSNTGAITASKAELQSVIIPSTTGLTVGDLVQFRAGDGSQLTNLAVNTGTPELEVDGGAELGTLAGWSLATGWSIDAVTGNARTGNYCVKHGASVAGVSAIGVPVPVIAGLKYYAEGYLKGSGSADGDAKVRLRWFDAALALLSVSAGFGVVSDGVYHRSSVLATAPVGAVFAAVEFRLDTTQTTGTWYGDDLSLQLWDVDKANAVFDSSDIPSTNNVIPNPAARLYTGAVQPDGWSVVSGATVTKNTNAAFYKTAGASAHVVASGAGQGVRTPGGFIFPTSTNPYLSGYATIYVISGQVKVQLVITQLGGGTIRVPASPAVASSTKLLAWEDLGVAGENANTTPIGVAVAVEIVSLGAAEFYVDAAQATQSASQLPFVEGSGGTRLWQAANDFLRTNGGPALVYDVPMVDLERVERAGNPAAAVEDGFDANTGGYYVETNDGTVGNWTLDSANSRLVGVNGLQSTLTRNDFTATDTEVEADAVQADDGGLVARWTDHNNYYLCRINDESSTLGSRLVNFFRKTTADGGFVNLGATAAGFTWPRGTQRTFKFRVTGSGATVTLAILVDGVEVLTFADTSANRITGAGKIGVRNNAGNPASIFNRLAATDLRALAYVGEPVTLGCQVNIKEDRVPLKFQTRVLGIERDYMYPANTKVTLSTLAQDLSGTLGRPAKPPRQAPINPTGTDGTGSDTPLTAPGLTLSFETEEPTSFPQPVILIAFTAPSGLADTEVQVRKNGNTYATFKGGSQSPIRVNASWAATYDIQLWAVNQAGVKSTAPSTASITLPANRRIGRDITFLHPTTHVDDGFVLYSTSNDGLSASSGVKESGGKVINRLLAKTLAADPDNADSVLAGSIRRVPLVGASDGSGNIDLSGSAWVNKNTDQLADGSMTARALQFSGGDNFAENGNFELTPVNVPSGVPGYTASNATISLDAVSPFAGNKSLRVDATSQFGSGNSIRKWKARPGDVFIVTAAMRCNTASDIAVTQLQFLDANGTYLGGVQPVQAGSTSWQTISGTGTAPANTAWVIISCQNNRAGAGTVWFDDIRVYRVREATSEVMRGSGDTTPLGTIVQNLDGTGNAGSAFKENGGRLVSRLLAKTLVGDADSLDGAPDGVTYKRVQGVNSGVITDTSVAKNVGLGLFDNGSKGANFTLDWNNGNIQKVTLTATGLTVTLSNPSAGRIYTVIFIQDGTGGRAMPAFSPSLDFGDAGTPSALWNLGASKKNVISMLYDGSTYISLNSGTGY